MCHIVFGHHFCRVAPEAHTAGGKKKRGERGGVGKRTQKKREERLNPLFFSLPLFFFPEDEKVLLFCPSLVLAFLGLPESGGGVGLVVWRRLVLFV